MGLGEGGDGAIAVRQFGGAALRPPAPVHLRAERRPDGGLVLGWTRRSRAGWDWTSGETPLGEERESYRVTVLAERNVIRVADTAEPFFEYPAAHREADGAAGTVTIEVVQVGTHAASQPSRISIA
jgi:hypothetical protein